MFFGLSRRTQPAAPTAFEKCRTTLDMMREGKEISVFLDRMYLGWDRKVADLDRMGGHGARIEKGECCDFKLVARNDIRRLIVGFGADWASQSHLPTMGASILGSSDHDSVVECSIDLPGPQHDAWIKDVLRISKVGNLQAWIRFKCDNYKVEEGYSTATVTQIRFLPELRFEPPRM